MLRPYQVDLESKIKSALAEGFARVMVQLPTGGGKTVIVTNLVKGLLMKGLRTVFIAHREELITQAWNTFHKNKIMSGVIKSKVAPSPGLNSQVGSIQTMIRRKALPPADVVFIDEAHHALDDNSYGKVIAEHFPDAIVIGVTATPYRLNGKGFTKLFQTLIESVQIEDLINMGYLSPIRYFIASIPNLNKVTITRGDYDQDQAHQIMKFAPIVQSYKEHANGLCGMVFAVSVEHSLFIVDEYRKEGISAAHIDATTPPEDRREIIQAFRERKIKVLSNVGIANEGFDVPNMDFVQLARPTKSLSLYLQMVGRGGRVDNEVIKDCLSDEQRKFAISCSAKPHCIILDNAGLWKDHGLPDEPRSWALHFKGTKKDKKKIEEFIEIIEFVAEDKDGRTVRTTIPDELDGLKLIEVVKTLQERIPDYGSLKEFERLINMGYRLPQVKKVGYVAVRGYLAYCKREKILVNEQIWQALNDRLITQPRKLLEVENSTRIEVLNNIQLQYDGDQERINELTKKYTEASDKRISSYNALLVSRHFLRDLEEKYTKFKDVVNA